MYNLNRVFFLSSGIFCLILIPFFWGAVHFLDYIAFENFIVQLTSSKFVGYPIPELVGSSNQIPLEENVSRFKNVFVSLLSFYGTFLISISYVTSSAKRWKLFSLSLGFPLLIILFGLWIKFINDDHIIGTFEKQQLFQFTYILIIATTCCFFIGLRKPKSKKHKKVQSTPQKKIENLSLASVGKTDPPSTDTTLNDNNETVAEEDLKQESTEGSGGVPEEISIPGNTSEPSNEEGNDHTLEGVIPEGLQEDSGDHDETEHNAEGGTEEEVLQEVENVLPPEDIDLPSGSILPPLESSVQSEEALPQKESLGDVDDVITELVKESPGTAGKPN